MDDLKRLLRRLDGLDGSKGLTKNAEQPEAEQRGYVGALRGAPVHGDEETEVATSVAAQGVKKGPSAPIFLAALIAAVVSTVTVYMVMSAQDGPGGRGAGSPPASERVVPSKLDYAPPAVPGGTAPRQSNDAIDALIRRAEQLLRDGDVPLARALLAQAAELGSGPAALRLGRSYDPSQSETLRYADSQTNPALAKAWYERALALGTREAAGYISNSDGQ
ncbi:hypothetical protein [Hyphomicrobium sp. CS1GBMeth3]|uniref:hypothetical protein n=1 Tax=Hyphomicrobium sp. CS1GBMeth3 TaxID=1892845 RepID=UPI0009302333|nr:hypothetical protein [Hyphomicrobium sp. CS1GBMeth3]